MVVARTADEKQVAELHLRGIRGLVLGFQPALYSGVCRNTIRHGRAERAYLFRYSGFGSRAADSDPLATPGWPAVD